MGTSLAKAAFCDYYRPSADADGRIRAMTSFHAAYRSRDRLII
jgi:hypothetical protein